jgi:hypothetical protein
VVINLTMANGTQVKQEFNGTDFTITGLQSGVEYKMLLSKKLRNTVSQPIELKARTLI